MPVVTLDVPALGNRAHVVHDGRHAVAIDPPRDVTALEQALEDARVDLVAVADTHVHNDYVSGGLTLARRHGADYLLAADEAVSFERVGVRDGDTLTYGAIALEVIGTPGHTRHHQAFLARVGHSTDAEAALFSGGSLLLGTVGRTDLVDPRLALHLAGAQWDSVRALASLDPATRLHPTHGFGSFCAGSAVVDSDEEGPDTIGGQLASHPALHADRASFAAGMVAGYGPVPAYYPHMDPINRSDAGSPRPLRVVSATQVSAALAQGSWVIDTRDRVTHAAGHLRGAVGFEYGDQFATYVGWLVPWGHDLVLLADDQATLRAAATQLADIGIDDIGGHVLTKETVQDASFRRATWAELAAADSPVVVDVRQRDEWSDGHLPGAIHLPVQDIEHRLDVLPDRELWVHCRSGYRAGIAASLLHRHGRDVVHVDDVWERVSELAIPTIPDAA